MSDDRPVIKQMLGDNKERTAAWIMRGIIVGSLMIIGWFSIDLISTVKTDIKELRTHDIKEITNKVGDLDTTILNTKDTLDTLSAKYDLTRAARDQQLNGISAELGDHENRLRVLERPPH